MYPSARCNAIRPCLEGIQPLPPEEPMIVDDPHLHLRLAESESDLLAAQRLRYRVFVEELGGNGPLVDHSERLERDQFDPYFDHLVLVDDRRDVASLDHVIGVYRVMRSDQARAGAGFYSAGEYDLGPIEWSGRRLLELGRSCVHPDYRGGTAMLHLWTGLADYVRTHGIELLFGVASFPGTDAPSLAQPLSYLHHHHLAPPDLRVRARVDGLVDMNLLSPDRIDRKAAMKATPALIKAYLRLGGFVGEGAWIDRAFRTTDVCLVMDTSRMNDRQRAIYERRGP
jgi:L-ornithine Nalpha-acyltransferase